ncbi:MAG: hypothetical protein RR799_09610 [Lachnospiraceae bacterium]
MKRTKEGYPSFNLFPIICTWESVNLNLRLLSTVMIELYVLVVLTITK